MKYIISTFDQGRLQDNVISTAKCIRSYAGIGLREARDIVDKLNGKPGKRIANVEIAPLSGTHDPAAQWFLAMSEELRYCGVDIHAADCGNMHGEIKCSCRGSVNVAAHLAIHYAKLALREAVSAGMYKLAEKVAAALDASAAHREGP